MVVGLDSSSVLCLLVALGAVAVISSDSDKGSRGDMLRILPGEREMTIERHTVHLDLVNLARYTVFTIMSDRVG
jgi:hypothetical protein